MKKCLFIKKTVFLGFCLSFIGLLTSSLANSATFQNNNDFCQTTPVLCQSSNDPDGCAGGNLSFNAALSLSCKDSTFDTDFNGDHSPDCVAAVLKDTGFEHVSVLLNKGNQSTDCDAAVPGKIFEDSRDFVANSLKGKTDFTNVVTSRSGASQISEFSLIAQNGLTSLDFVSSLIAQNGLGNDSSIVASSSQTIGSLDSDKNIPMNLTNQDLISLECNPSNPTPVIAYVSKNVPTQSLHLNYFRKDQPNQVVELATYVAFDPLDINSTKNAFLASGDFNQDGRPDILMAYSSPDERFIGIFFQQQDCTFSAKDPMDPLARRNNDMNGRINALKVGDFDGDGSQDAAVYYMPFGVGQSPEVTIIKGSPTGDLQAGAQILKPFDSFPDLRKPNRVKGMTVGCFDNDDKTDIIVAGGKTTGPFIVSLLNSNENFSSTELKVDDVSKQPPFFSLPYSPDPFSAAIESVNLDRKGGDDVVLVTSDSVGKAVAGVWINEVENLTASAGVDLQIKVNVPVTIHGKCADANSPVQAKSFKWSITPSNLVVATGLDTLDPVITVKQEGTYKATLICQYRCAEMISDSALLTTAKSPEDPKKDPGTFDVPSCGDGIIQKEFGEECDPPNGTSCDRLCHRLPTGTQPSCGDGIVQRPEICDHGKEKNGTAGDSCNANCFPVRDSVTGKIPLSCGNGIVESQNGEECDSGQVGRTPDCTEDCKKPTGEKVSIGDKTPAEAVNNLETIAEGSGGCSLQAFTTQGIGMVQIMLSLFSIFMISSLRLRKK